MCIRLHTPCIYIYIIVKLESYLGDPVVRHRGGEELGVPRLEGLAVGPSLEVLVVVRGPVDGPPGGPHHGVDLPREVLEVPAARQPFFVKNKKYVLFSLFVFFCWPCEDLPEDRGGLRPPRVALMDQEEELQPAVRVELQEDPEVLDATEGLG